MLLHMVNLLLNYEEFKKLHQCYGEIIEKTKL